MATIDWKNSDKLLIYSGIASLEISRSEIQDLSQKLAMSDVTRPRPPLTFYLTTKEGKRYGPRHSPLIDADRDRITYFHPTGTYASIRDSMQLSGIASIEFVTL